MIKRDGPEHVVAKKMIESMVEKAPSLAGMLALRIPDEDSDDFSEVNVFQTVFANFKFSRHDKETPALSSKEYRIVKYFEAGLMHCKSQSRPLVVGGYKGTVKTFKLTKQCASPLINDLVAEGFATLRVANLSLTGKAAYEDYGNMTYIRISVPAGQWTSPNALASKLSLKKSTMPIASYFDFAQNNPNPKDALDFTQSSEQYGFDLLSSSVTAKSAQFKFEIRKGWGSCSGTCNHGHTWDGEVSAIGTTATTRITSESGEPLQP